MTESSNSSNRSEQPIRLAMLGMIPGNGHPWSWSAIVNGYDPEVMAAKCTYPGIIDYLDEQPLEEVGIPGARVTHLWTDDPSEAPPIAEADFIEHVVDRPEDVIGEVDAVIVSTDDGSDHVRRARPFVEAGLPVFVDKPMADNLADLAWFLAARCRGARVLSSSAMRYASEIRDLRGRLKALGNLRWISSFTAKTWEKYGIHALELAYGITGPGYSWVRTVELEGGDVVTAGHQNGLSVTLPAIHDAYGSFGVIQVCGTDGYESLQFRDTYFAFRAQLVAVIDSLRTGRDSHPFSETVEQILVVIAGLASRAENGRRIEIATLRDRLMSQVREMNGSDGMDPEEFLRQVR
jgi:predicted dehydrogenase